MTKTALILLAAGSSTRMGEPKQLLDYGGKPLLRHAVETALASQCSPVIVVLGANAARIAPALSGLDVTVVENQLWAEGMGTSIQSGLAEVATDSSVTGAILALADQPLVNATVLDGLIARHRESGMPIVAASYAGTVGVPVYFARSAFASLEALPPSQGCKGVILAYGESALRVPCPEAEWDVDTPADYEKALARA